MKRLNDINPGVRRPIRVSDLQDVYSSLSEALASGTANNPKVISGFSVKPDNTYSAGVLAFNEKLYFHPDTDGYRIGVGSSIYVGEVDSGDSRIFADSSTQIFSYNQIVTTNSSGNTYVGIASAANIDSWRFSGVPDGSITSAKLAPDSVTTDKIAPGAVTSADIATNAVGSLQIANSAVTSTKLGGGAAASNIGPLGGSLTGSLPNPLVAMNAIGVDNLGVNIFIGDITTAGFSSDGPISASFTPWGSGYFPAPTVEMTWQSLSSETSLFRLSLNGKETMFLGGLQATNGSSVVPDIFTTIGSFQTVGYSIGYDPIAGSVLHLQGIFITRN